MPNLDDFNQDELLCLRDDIERFFRAFDITERAFCEGWEEWEDLNKDAIAAGNKLRDRIRGLAIALGIHAVSFQHSPQAGGDFHPCPIRPSFNN